MKYKTPSYLRASGSLVGLAGPGRPGAWERDCRNGSPAAGSEAIEMRAGPVGRLAGEVGQAEGAPRAQAKARQEAAEASIRRDPVVKSIVERFEARVVEDSIRPAETSRR